MHVLLVGNGSYLNRGCEAIVRGTMLALRAVYGSCVTVTNAVLGSAQEVRLMREREYDSGISHCAVAPARPRWHWVRVKGKVLRTIGVTVEPEFPELLRPLRHARCVMQIGGDNYTMDYGSLRYFVDIDRFLLARGAVLVHWGSSIGPFGQDRFLEEKMVEHLRRFSFIGARESLTFEYLKGLDPKLPVHLVGDPAFLLEPVPPGDNWADNPVEEGAIGLNLSNLMGRFAGFEEGGAEWSARCADAVESLIRATNRQIVLIPHVCYPDIRDDGALLSNVAQELRSRGYSRVALVSRDLTAAQYKWVIARCSVFAGARMHATIAAMSSTVPTLLLAYSAKARGICRDIYGSEAHCLAASEFTSGAFVAKVQNLLAHQEDIRALLANRIPAMKAAAIRQAELLKEVLHTKV